MTAQAPETIFVPANTDEVCCDGGSGPLGHPLVYYSFEGKSKIFCGYCGKGFAKSAEKRAGHAH